MESLEEIFKISGLSWIQIAKLFNQTLEELQAWEEVPEECVDKYEEVVRFFQSYSMIAPHEIRGLLLKGEESAFISLRMGDYEEAVKRMGNVK